jgi:hypothetical protein
VPAWVTVKISPPMLIVPLRCEAPVFALALKPTLPLPEPLAPLVTVSHDALLTAVHPQPPAALTVTVPDPAAAVSDWLNGEMDGSQGAENAN